MPVVCINVTRGQVIYMLTFLRGVYTKRCDIHVEIERMQRELEDAAAFLDKKDAFCEVRRVWYLQLWDCEGIERDALRLDGSLQLLMNLKTLDDQNAFLDKWDESLKPVAEVVAEDFKKIFKQADDFNFQLEHNLESMHYQDPTHHYGLHCQNTFLPNTEEGLRLLKACLLANVKGNLLQCTHASPRSSHC